MPSDHLAELIVKIAREADCSMALDILVQGAMTLTRSRRAMIALMSDEAGALEMRHVAGEAFQFKESEHRYTVDVASGHGIIAYVAATGKSVVTGDVHKEPWYRQRYENTASELAVPVTDRFERIRAVVNVESDQPDAYTPADEETCHALAALASIVLERQEQGQREAALMEIGAALDTALTEEALIDRVIRVAEETLRFQACSIFLYELASDSFVLRGSTSRLKSQVGEIRYKRGEGCTGWVCDTGLPILLQSPQDDPRWRGRYVEFPSEQIASFLAVPIVTRGKSIGAIRVVRRVSENRYLDNRFTENDQKVLQAIAEQIATGLENVRNLEMIIRSERMIAWGELSAKSSHMIGNRVFALKGDVNELGFLVAEDQPDFDALRQVQKSLATNVLRIEEILQDFRDFVSATQLNRVPGDLNQVVRETIEEVIPKRGEFELEVQLDQGMPLVPMDAAKLRRAVSELLENSLQHMNRGKLAVTTGLEQGKGGTHWAIVQVQDSGPGVDPDQKALIFQPFFSNRVKGMGLGLSIVKGIVEAHGGSVVESGEKGAGARFVIRLPVADRP